MVEEETTDIVKENKELIEEEKSNELIDRANQSAERIETANKEFAKLLEKQERMQVEAKLSGTANAGQTQELTQEQKEIERARNTLKGTGFEDDLFPKTK